MYLEEQFTATGLENFPMMLSIVSKLNCLSINLLMLLILFQKKDGPSTRLWPSQRWVWHPSHLDPTIKPTPFLQPCPFTTITSRNQLSQIRWTCRNDFGRHSSFLQWGGNTPQFSSHQPHRGGGHQRGGRNQGHGRGGWCRGKGHGMGRRNNSSSGHSQNNAVNLLLMTSRPRSPLIIGHLLNSGPDHPHRGPILNSSNRGLHPLVLTLSRAQQPQNNVATFLGRVPAA